MYYVNLLILKWITAHPPVSFLKKCTTYSNNSKGFRVLPWAVIWVMAAVNTVLLISFCISQYFKKQNVPSKYSRWSDSLIRHEERTWSRKCIGLQLTALNKSTHSKNIIILFSSRYQANTRAIPIQTLCINIISSSIALILNSNLFT